MESASSGRRLHLDEIENTILDWRFKGIPERAFGARLGEIGRLELNALDDDMAMPCALLRESSLEHNSQWMRKFIEGNGVRLCPHGKTSMAPQLFQRQLADGAWGITAATIAHLRVYRHHGIKRVLFANQLIGDADIDYVFRELQEYPDFDFYCLVDSLDSLVLLTQAARQKAIGRPLQVLIEVGTPGGRTGIRTVADGMTLGREIARHRPFIALRGIEAFEGVFPGYDHDALESSVAMLLDRVVDLARAGETEAWFAEAPIILSAGGSAFFDLVVSKFGGRGLTRPVETVLRSGCYLTHDDRHYEEFARRMRERTAGVRSLGEGLRPAIELCAWVQSVPEPGCAIVGLGKRDASHDIDLPVPIWWFRRTQHERPQRLPAGCSVTKLNDQHAYISIPDDFGLAVGDVLGFGISHPCTTFDKWPLLLVVNDEYDVVSAVRTFF